MGYKVLKFNAQGDTANQVAGMENFITKGVDGAIIAQAGHAFRDISQAYDKAGIPLVAVDMVLPGQVAHLLRPTTGKAAARWRCSS